MADVNLGCTKLLVHRLTAALISKGTYQYITHRHLFPRLLTIPLPPPGLEGIAPEVKAKARKMALWVGGLAGCFGSVVGVGGGVLISPVIANACRCACVQIGVCMRGPV